MRLGDGQAKGHADVEVQLATGRVVGVEQQSVPGRGGVVVEGYGLLDGALHQVAVIDIDGGLEEEGLRVGLLLGAVPLFEAVVVGGTEGELRLQRLVAATYVVHHLLEPRLGREAVIGFEQLFRHAPLVGFALRVECNLFTYCSHDVLLF